MATAQARKEWPRRLAAAMDGRTCAYLAQKVGVHPTTVSRWTKGKRLPDLDNQEAVAAALGSTVDELFPRSLR